MNKTTRQVSDSSFLMPKMSSKFDRGHPLRRCQMQVGWVKIGDFRQITDDYISKTVKDRHRVSIKVEQEVVCALSNGGIAHDLECPLTTQTTPFSAFCTAVHSFVTGEPRDFEFGTLTYHSKSHPADKKSSLKGAWLGSADPFQNFTPPCKISATANARDFKFYTRVGHAKSQSCDE